MAARSTLTLCTLLALPGLGAASPALGVGAAALPAPELLRPLLRGPAVDPVVAATVWEIRLPRVLLALLAGAALAQAGVAMQGIFRNPLAEPAVVGVSGGAAVAAVAVIVAGEAA